VNRDSWTSYAALGDALSAAEGWVGRLAVILDGHARLSGRQFDFHDFSATAGTITHIVQHQVPRAIAAGADLVTIMAGNTELLRRGPGSERLARELRHGVATLRATGATVLLVTCFDPQPEARSRPYRERAASFNAQIWSIGRAHGAGVIDAWDIHGASRVSAWTNGRIELSERGHRALAARAAHVLGVPYAEAGAFAGAVRPRIGANMPLLPREAS
jgi:GDSL-like Lipase/Acylhydrolase.